MKNRIGFFKATLLITLLLGLSVCASAQEKTEVYGFYEGYRNFDFKTGDGFPTMEDIKLNGGGGGIAYNLAPWFAMWTQVSFFGTAKHQEFTMRVINNLQGVRYQTEQYGPFRLYAKGGVGFTNYGVSISGSGFGSTKLSVGYGGGAQIWVTDYFGLVLEGFHLVMGVPQLTEADGRDKWDSGLTFKTGLAVRF